ncbi:MAG: cytochrome c biogenesis protein ResB [Thermodesulfovibrio sp.]|nr:cytochrome c biogenesis protein ResB [Thermodesulfovibrio sp.]MDW7997958.1 cytochrome c biogenesis protein ResB [Thermodesulfovibrio sp.]
MSKIDKWNEKIWSFFASVDLAIALFIFISTGAALGTIIPQQSEPEMIVRFFSNFFSPTTAMKAYEIVSLLDLNNVYHSWWFTFLLFMFALNLIVCSVERLPYLLKSFKTVSTALPVEVLENMPFKKKIENVSPDVSHKISEILKKKGFTVNIFETQDGIQIQGRKWSKTRLAVYLTHLSILIILSGTLIGTFFGFRGSMNIIEGRGLNFAISDSGKAIPLGFEVRCDRFEVEYYENSSIPKAYRSYIRILENGEVIKFNGKENVVIEVNQPFSYKGITFYQASYGFQPSEHAEFRFSYFDHNNMEHNISAKFEEKFNIPGTSVKASVIDFSPALGIDEQGRLFNMDTNMINPAVLVRFEQGDKKTEQWILTKIPETWNTPYGKLKFHEIWGAQFTGLQVRKDPGVPLIYIGSLFLCVGLFISLFLRPVTLFAKLSKNRLDFYCPSSKVSSISEKQIDKIINKLKGEKV